MHLPEDPFILLSYINTQIRELYPSLEELQKSLGVYVQTIENKLSAIDYHYDAGRNQFV